MMRCILGHLCLQEGTGIVIKKVIGVDGAEYNAPVAKSDIEYARWLLRYRAGGQLTNSVFPSAYALDEFLSDQLHNKLPK